MLHRPIEVAPTSGHSPNQKVALVKGNNRPRAAIHRLLAYNPNQRVGICEGGSTFCCHAYDMTSDSIGNFSNQVLLTGAGWSRNWGGRLASEIWQAIMGRPVVKSNSRLRDLLLDEPSFELALAKTHAPPFTTGDRQDFERALLEVFISMDREIGRPDHDPWINIYKVQELLFRFWGHRNQSINTGYLFTLNQDLFFERNLYNEHLYGAPAPSLPGLQRRPNQPWFTANIGPYSDDFIMQPTADAAQWRLRGQMNVVKLHGSFNWRTSDGRSVMVVGTAKTTQIASLPLLEWYADVFKKVLTVGRVRLMIAGYGFGDSHINAVIAKAIENNGLKVFIWDTGPNLKDRVLAASHGATIWSGLLSTATRVISEVFPSNQAETEEYGRIKQTFFA